VRDDTIYIVKLGTGEYVAENYKSAALRHFEDAVALQSSGRPDNAGHLVGFAAECAIKHKIVSLRSAANASHLHFPDLLVVARKQLGARSRYSVSMFDVLKPDIFSGWHVNRRYDETGSTDVAELTEWFNVTKRLFATAGLKVKK
jgi:hypothetical protein